MAYACFVVCRVIAIGAINQIIFAGFCQRMELTRYAAADLATIGNNRAVIKAATLADATVGIVHFIVGFLQGFLAGMEAVCVLHNEFAAAQQAKTGANLIAELRLNLIERHGELTVGT